MSLQILSKECKKIQVEFSLTGNLKYGQKFLGNNWKWFEALEEYTEVSENTQSKWTNHPMHMKYAERSKKSK